MIKATCPNCGKRFRAPDDYAGREGRCRACGTRFVIQSPPHPAHPGDGDRLLPPLPAPGDDAPQQVAAPTTGDANAPLPLATPGLICGFVGLLVPLVNIAAIVLGIVALTQFDDEVHREGDRRKSVAAIVLGVVGLLLQLLTLLVAILAGMFMLRSAPPVVASAPPPSPPQVSVPLEPSPPALMPSIPTLTPPPQAQVSSDVYYLDLGTGQLFAAGADNIAPIDAPSGGEAGVRAYVFSCNDCSDERQQFVGWLERHIASAKRLREQGDNANVDVDGLIDALTKPIQVSIDDGQTWTALHPIEYMQWQLRRRQSLCGGGATLECKPQPATNP